MNIFSRRPLSLILCIILGGFSLFALIDSSLKFLLFTIPPIIFGISLIKRFKAYSLLLRISAIFLLFSLLISHLYFDKWFKAYERFSDEEIVLEGEIISVTDGFYSANIDIQCSSVNNKPFTKYKIKAYIDPEKFDIPAPGDTIIAFGKLTKFESDFLGFDSKAYYFSNGYNAELKDISYFDIIIHAEHKGNPLESMRNKIRARIFELTSSEAAGLFIALFLGNKENLSPKLAFDFSRIGLSHALALSGMHLAIIVLGLTKLASLIGIGKKSRTALVIPFTLIYMLLTGMPVSVIRAGIMLIISSLLYLIAKSKDSMTTLFMAVSLICIFNPSAVFDLSLWLSAFATFGIVSLTDYETEYKKNTKFKDKAKSFILGSFFVSFCAVAATILISAYSFNTISIISPISTFVFSFFIEAFLYLGIFTLIYGNIIPSGKLLSALNLLMTKLADVLSGFRYAAVSTNFVLLKILIIIFTFAFVLFLILKIKRKRTAITVLALSFIVLCAITPFFSLYREYDDRITYHRYKKTETLIVSGEGVVSVIDEDAYTDLSARYTLFALNDEKISYVDNYIFGNYSKAMPYKLEKLFSSVKIKHVLIPSAMNDDEEKLFEMLQEIAEYNSATIETFATDQKIDLGAADFELNIRMSYNFDGSRSVFTLIHNGERISYFSSNTLAGVTRAAAANVIVDSNYIIFGSHGTRYNNYYLTYDLDAAHTIIFSSKNMYISNYVKNKYTDKELYYDPEKVVIIR